jgi:hypothetical protein
MNVNHMADTLQEEFDRSAELYRASLQHLGNTFDRALAF